MKDSLTWQKSSSVAIVSKVDHLLNRAENQLKCANTDLSLESFEISTEAPSQKKLVWPGIDHSVATFHLNFRHTHQGLSDSANDCPRL